MKMGMTLLSVLTILFLIFVCLPASFAQNTSPKNLVRLIYFLPNDRAPQPGIDTKLDRQIKDAQLLFADLLEEHGFERKTFQFETDARGNAVVHRVNGRFAASHYHNSPEAAWAELPRQFDRSKDIYLFSIDVGIFDPVGDIVLLDPAGNPVGQGCFSDSCGIGTWRDKGASGLAAVPPIDEPAVAHELGHAFGLMHDYRRLVQGRDPMLVSFCAAEWLDVNRYFNDFPPSSDAQTTIRMLPPLAAPSYAIRLRFEVNDPDGLHQAQLQILPTEGVEGTSPKIINNKSLNSERATVEFVTTELIGGSTTAATKVWLQVTDVLGNFTVQEFTINIASLLPRPEAISVPDDNLAAAIRRELGMAPRAAITQLNMLSLQRNLVADWSKIIDLTGLEHAINLKYLSLKGNQIRDITPLAGLTQLRTLNIEYNQISDIGSLTSLVNLEEVSVGGNPLTTIPPIAQVDFLFGSDKVTVIERGKFIVYSDADRTILNPAVPATVKMLNFDKLLHSSNLTGFFDQGGTIELLTLTEAEFGDVVISEIMWGLDKSAPNNQWIELYNTTSNDVTLEPGGWGSTWAFQFSYNTTGEWKNVKVHGWKVIDRVSNIDWKVPGQSGNTSQNQPLISMYRDINYETGSVPDGTLANSWKASTGRVNLLPPSYGTPGAKHLPPSPVVVKTDPVERPTTPIDPSQPAIYWRGKNGIQRANPDGSNATILVPREKVRYGTFPPDPAIFTLDVLGGKMYWTNEVQNSNSSNMLRANLDGSNVQMLVAGKGTISHLTVDVSGGKIYWIEKEYKQIRRHEILLTSSKIRRANLDGSNVQTLVESKYGLSDLTLEVSGGKMYWQNTGGLGIHRANLNGSNVEKLKTLNNLLSARESTLNISGGKMYWIGRPENGLPIRRANLDGTRVETLGKINKIGTYFTVDASGEKIYWIGWVDGIPKKIQCANLDGSNVKTLVTEKTTIAQLTLDVPAGKMYWMHWTGTDVESFTIQRANLDGSNHEDITATSGGPFVLIPSQAPAPVVRKTIQVHVDAADRPPMYWIDTQAGTLHRLVAAEVENIVPSVRNANNLSLDVANEKLYWTEKTSHTTGRIQSANLDGTNVQLVKHLTSVPFDITFNAVDSKLYLTNSWGKVQRLNLDGSGFQPNLITGLDTPMNLAVDVTNEKLYWTEQTGDTTGRIQRANLNGSNIELVKKLTSVPKGLTIDALNGKLYLTNSWGKVQRLNLNGTNFQSNLITDLNSPENIVVNVAGGKLYWIEQDSIKRANLNGDNIQNVVTGLGAPANLVLGTAPVDAIVQAAPAAVIALPNETRLHSNYPNPFNPETWIPYHLAESADVTLTIYDINGRVVQHLDLGHQRAGFYQSKARAAYWNGRNVQAEPVASGVYFYTLKAGDFSATKKMLIQK